MIVDSPDRWVSRQAEARGDAPALRGRVRLSYRELECRLNSIAGVMRRSGVSGGHHVLGLQLEDVSDLALLLMGGMRAGKVVMPVDPRMGEERRDRLLEATGCKTLLQRGGSGEFLPGVQVLQAEILLGPVEGREPVDAAATELTGRDVVLIVPTSGTTGMPRGVMLTAGNLLASVQASRRRIPLEAGDVWIDCLPLHHIGGLSVLFRCFQAGACVLLHQGFEPERVWSDLARERVTHLSLVPVMLHRLLEFAGNRPPPSSLRTVLVGGGALSPELAERAHAGGWPICVSYGMSETASQLATDCSPSAGLAVGAVGHPLDHCTVRQGRSGRLEIRGEALMAGYANPELRPGDGLEGGWYLSGDVGEIAADGTLSISGRADDLLTCGGRTIHPAEVEALLMRCPGVTAARVGGRPDPVWGDLLIAWVVSDMETDELEAWCRHHIPGPLRPRDVIRVGRLPETVLGKPMRRDCS